MVNLARRGFLRGELTAGRAIARIGAGCVAYANVVCRRCGDACMAQAIRFRPVVMAAARPEIDPERCTGCGDCVAPCPARAIRL